MDRCLTLDPAARPTMSQLLEHPWFSDPEWNPLTDPDRVKGMGGPVPAPAAFLPPILPPGQGGGWHSTAGHAAVASGVHTSGVGRDDSDDL